MRLYTNAKEIEDDLAILKLKRDITIEELKMVKQDLKDDLSLSSWVESILKTVGKIGLYKVAKKIV